MSKNYYYQSLTMGNVVETKREILAQVFESLFRYKTLDIKWVRVER